MDSSLLFVWNARAVSGRSLRVNGSPPARIRTPRLPPSVSEIRSISCVFIWSFFGGRSSSWSVKKQCVQRMSQTEVTRMFSKIGENGWPIASFAYRLSNSFVVKSITTSKLQISYLMTHVNERFRTQIYADKLGGLT